MFIERLPEWVRRLAGDALFRMPECEDGRKVVYLTFDDGPIPEVTPQILDFLDKEGIKATFFMVGDNVRKYPELFKEVLRRGHRVGNHTMHHLQGLHKSNEEYLADVAEADRYIHSNLFRPPHGWMKRGQRDNIRSKYRIVMYDLVTRDYSKRLNAEDVYANVRKYVRSGSIIVFHDSLKSLPRLFKSLGNSVRWLKEQGYEFDTIDG